MNKPSLDTQTASGGIIGTIRLNSKGVGFIDQENDKSIEIQPENLNTAMHLDMVSVEITNPKPNRFDRLTGRVTEIVTRNKTQFVGIVTEAKDDKLMVQSDDVKLYVPIIIPKVYGVNIGQKVVVKINDWTDPAKSLTGNLIQVLGEAGEHNTEMQAIVFGQGLIIDFPTEVETEAEEINKNAAQEIETEAKNRRDFRGILTCTIDPVDAKDFDDALSFQKLANGDIEVGVHIADVTHYVKPGSALDKEASKRATSIYLVDRTIPMLPEVLSNHWCSLMPEVDRLTFSAVFTFNQKGDLIGEWFGKTIIHSTKRFAYEDVAAILEVPPGGDVIKQSLHELNRLAKKLQAEKLDAGALVFEESEVKFKLDTTGKPIGVTKKERNDAHKLIEDFMLLANKKTAEYAGRVTKEQNGRFVYRIHDYPKEERIKSLQTFLGHFGKKLTVGKKGVSAYEINRILTEAADTPEADVINKAVVQSMAKAVYSMSNIGHFGLAFDHYTHFTSPIRRYPDMMVHRLLEIYLAKKNPTAEMLELYSNLVNHTSAMEKKAAEAERDSIKLKQVEYMGEHIGEEFDGVISGVTEWGMYVEELETKSEGLVRLANLGDDYYMFDEKQYAIVGTRTKKRYRLGDKIRVKVISADVKRRQLDYGVV